jgi:hypothetical protein
MFSYLMFTSSPLAHASTPAFTKSFVRYDTLKESAVTTGRVCFQPSINTTMVSVSILFPTNSSTNYALGAAAAWGTLNTNNLDSGQTAVPAGQISGETTTVSSQTVTFTWGASWTTPSTATLYCFNWTNGTGNSLTLPNNSTETAAGVLSSYTTGGSTLIDQSNFSYSSALLASPGAQVTVNAVVPPSFNFTLSGTTDAFTTANLSTASYNITTGNTIGVTTNAASGYIVWADDTNYATTGITDSGSSPANEHGALKSTTANYAISNDSNSTSQKNISGTVNGAIASHAFTSLNEDYGLQVALTTAGTGYGTSAANAAYIATTAAYAGTLNPTYYEPIASTTVAGTANGVVLTVKELASISGNTPAASDYTDTIKYTAAGQF